MFKTNSDTLNIMDKLEQLNLYMGIYMENNNDYFPKQYTFRITGGEASWDNLFGAYDGRNLSDANFWAGEQRTNKSSHCRPATEIYKCPSESIMNSFYFIQNYALNRGGVGYGHDSDGKDAIGNWRCYGVVGYKVTRLTNPSKTICLAEMRGSWNVLGSRSNYADGPKAGTHNNFQPSRGDWGENFPPLHSSKWNYIFSDGHVECLDPYETVGKDAELPGMPYVMWAHQPCPNCFK